MTHPEDKLGKGSRFRKLFDFIRWLLWDFSGLRFVWEKIRPPDPSLKVRPPATFLLWVSGVLGIYVAVFTIASQRYENRIDIIENRANSIFAQLSSPVEVVRKTTLSRIPEVQNMLCPHKPEILKPFSVFHSLLKKNKYKEIVELLKDAVENWKNSLDSVSLIEANLEEANLWQANLEEADLEEANLWGAKNLTIEQLSKVETLYKAKLDLELEAQIKKKYPHLLEEPED